MTYTARRAGEPWHTFHEWTELSANTVGTGDEFITLALEISGIVIRNDLFPDELHQPLTARLRRDTALANAVAALVPTLPGPSVGPAVRLLALSGWPINEDLAHHLTSRLSNVTAEHRAAVIDPLTGRVSDLQLLLLDILDTIDSRP